MDKKYIFGKHTMDMPGLNTLKILKKRQIYLIKNVQDNTGCDDYKNSPLIKEIRALEKSMNFIEWVINNSSHNIVRETVEKYYNDNKKDDDETVDEDILKEKGILK
jgi:hypothetical protein